MDWTGKKKEKVNAVEMDFSRRSTRKSILEKIRRVMNVEETIMKVIGKIQVKWFGHLSRMNNTHIPKIVYKWELEGRRRRTTTVLKIGHSSDYEES